MNEISLETIYNIIELCKFSEVEGEKAELVVTPSTNNSRNIRIGINGGLSRDYFEYTVEDGISFDHEVLPLLVNRFLKDDKISSWVTKDPEIDDIPSKELIVSEKENEILIHTFDKDLHNLIKDNTEKIQLKSEEVEFTKEELAVEKMLKYLKEKFKKREELSKLPKEVQLELIAVIDNAYKLNKGRTLTDEQIYNFADNIHDGITNEAYNAIVNDIRNNNSKLINEIRSYLRNEHKYENYLDEEPYMSLNEVGTIISERGYFDIRYTFPQKAELSKLDEGELEKVLTSGYKSKYKLLAELKNECELNKQSKYVSLIDTYIGYIVKTTRAKMNKKSAPKEVKFKEKVQDYKLDDKQTLIDALKLYKGGKLDTEKLEVVVREIDNNYEINIRLSNGLSRDNNVFKFTKNDTFLSDVLPALVKEFENGDSIASDKDNADSKLFISGKGNELLVDKSLSANINTQKVEVPTPTVPEPVQAETKTVDVPKVETPAEKIPEEKPVAEEAALPKEEPKPTEEAKPAVELASDCKYLASYFRKEILREKGLLTPSGIMDIKNLANQSEDVKALEEAREKMQNGTLSKTKFDELHNLYRSLLSKNIKRGLQRPQNIEKNVTNEEKEKTEFDFLHDLVKNYKIQNVNGELKTVNRDNNLEVTFNSDDELMAVEFANYWNSAAGVKSINDGTILGETYAFGGDCRTLFNIILKDYNTDNELNVFRIKEEFDKAGIATSDQIYERLFRNDDHKNFFKEGIKCFKKVYANNNLNANTENMDAKEIIEEYKRIDALSDLEDTANLIIEYKDNGYVEVKIEDERENETKVTLYKKINEDYFNDKILDKIISNYVELDGVYKTKVVENENSNKCSIIAIGKNSNVLQIRDIDSKYLERIDNLFDSTKDVLEHSKSYGTK